MLGSRYEFFAHYFHLDVLPKRLSSAKGVGALLHDLPFSVS